MNVADKRLQIKNFLKALDRHFGDRKLCKLKIISYVINFDWGKPFWVLWKTELVYFFIFFLWNLLQR